MEISAREHILDKEGFTRDELVTWLFFDSRGLLYDDHQSAMHRILYPVYGMRPRRREQASNLSSKTKVASCSCSSGLTACRNSPFSILTLTFHVHVFSDRSASHGPRLVPQPSPTFVTRSRLAQDEDDKRRQHERHKEHWAPLNQLRSPAKSTIYSKRRFSLSVPQAHRFRKTTIARQKKKKDRATERGGADRVRRTLGQKFVSSAIMHL